MSTSNIYRQISLALLCLFSCSLHAESCKSYYFSPQVIKSEERKLRNHGTRIALGVLGLGASVIATVLTGGMATPLTYYTGLASIGAMTGSITFEGFSLLSPAQQYLTNKKTFQLLESAESFHIGQRKVNTTEIYRKFYQKWFLKEKSYSPQKVASILSHANISGTGVCIVKDLRDIDGHIYFRYATEEEIFRFVIEKEVTKEEK